VYHSIFKGGFMEKEWHAPHWKKLTTEERSQVIEWGKDGVGITEIAKRLGNKITRQRVKQILDNAKIPVTEIKRAKNRKAHNDRMFQKWGPKWQDKEWRRSAIYDAMREKFRNKKAHSYGVEFSIEFGDVIFPTHCPILGTELNYFAEGRDENSPSFDRIDPKKGYVKGNVAIISLRANRIKNDGTAEEHQKIADFINSALQQ
jgi:hypothetical protein